MEIHSEVRNPCTAAAPSETKAASASGLGGGRGVLPDRVQRVPGVAACAARTGESINRCSDVGGATLSVLVHRAHPCHQLYGTKHQGYRCLLRNTSAWSETKI